MATAPKPTPTHHRKHRRVVIQVVRRVRVRVKAQP